MPVADKLLGLCDFLAFRASDSGCLEFATVKYPCPQNLGDRFPADV